MVQAGVHKFPLFHSTFVSYGFLEPMNPLASRSPVKKLAALFVFLALALFPRSLLAQGSINGVVVISVSNTSTTITVDRVCNYVLVRENAASPSAVFSITLAQTATAQNFPAGAQFEFVAPPGVPFAPGQVIGNIVATAAGPFSFTASESTGLPSIQVRNNSGSGGGGALSIGQTPLTTAGDLLTVVSGALARLGQGGNGTFLGVSGGVLGFYAPTGSGTVNNCTTVGALSYYAASGIAVSCDASIIVSAASLTIGVSGTSTGTLALTGATSGTVTLTPQATAGTPTLTFPNASGTFAVSASSPIVLNAVTGNLTCPTCNVSAATVTSVGLTGFTTGIFSTAGSPVTSAGSLAVTIAGSSGGIPYFSTTAVLSSSAALTANGVLVGGGAGGAPTAISADTTVTDALFATAGAPAFRPIAGTDIPTLNQNTTGTSANVTGIVAIAHGGTGNGTTVPGNTVFGNNNGSAAAPAFVPLTGAMLPLPSATTLGGIESITCGGITFVNAISTSGVPSCATPTSNGVTSVAETFTGGLVSVGGSPITTTGTFALTVAGTSGGVPYFSSTSTWASSALLTANGVMLGGGAGGAPSVTAADSTTTHALFATAGAPAFRAIGTGDIPTLNQSTTGTAANVTGIVALANGGTNATTQGTALTNIMPTPTRAGDVVYYNGANWVSLAGNNSGTNFLQETSSGVPSWVAAASCGTCVTSAAALTSNALVIGGGLQASSTLASLGNSGAPLLSAGAGSPPAFGALNLAGGSTVLTGILPIANGGTGSGSTVAAHTFFGNNTGSSANPVFGLLGPNDFSPTQYVAGAGSVNVMTATLAPAATALVVGLQVNVLPNLANTTTTPTLNVNGLGAKTITKYGTVALLPGDYSTTAIANFIYDGTEWQLENPQISTLTVPATLQQASNGQNVLTCKRFTDVAPTGNCFEVRDTANNLLYWVDVLGIMHAASSQIVGSGVGYMTGGSGVCPSSAVTSGNFGICLGDGTSNTVQITNNGTAWESAVLWNSTTPTLHGVIVNEGFPAVAATGAGVFGQLVTSNGASSDPTYQYDSLVVAKPNCASGTVLNKLVKLGSSAGAECATVTTTGDTQNAIGICVFGCGNTGTAAVSLAGQQSCIFDGSTTVNDIVVISSSTTGNCHDSGSTSPPTALEGLGRVSATNTGTGTYAMTLLTPDAGAAAGSGIIAGPSGSQTIQPTTDATGLIVKCFNGTNVVDCFELLDKNANKTFYADASGGIEVPDLNETIYLDGSRYTRDDTGFANALAAVGSGGTIVIPANVSVLETTSHTLSVSNVTIRCEAGGGFTAGASLTAHGMLQVTATQDRILDCTFLPGSFAGSYPIQLNGSTQAVIEGDIANGFTNSNGVFVQLQDNSGTPATENVIRKNFCSQGASGGACVAGYGSSTNNRVVDNDFSGGIIFHSNTTGKAVSGNMAIGNRILHGIGSGFCIEVGDFGGDSPDGWVAADNFCKLFGSGTHGGYSFVNLQGAVSVTGNTFRANGFTFNNAALEMGTMTNGAAVTGNHLYGDGTRACLEFDGNDSNVVATGNDLYNCGIYDGSSIASSTLNDAIINNNQITWAGNHNLIWVQANGATLNVNGAQICGNTLKGDATSGSIGIKIEADSGGSVNGTLICPNVFDSIDTAIGNYGGTLTIIKAQQFLGTVNNLLTIGSGGTVMSVIPMPFAKLPSCVAALNGNEANLSDSNTAVAYNSAVTAGSGTTKIHVVCQGTSWAMQWSLLYPRAGAAAKFLMYNPRNGGHMEITRSTKVLQGGLLLALGLVVALAAVLSLAANLYREGILGKFVRRLRQGEQCPTQVFLDSYAQWKQLGGRRDRALEQLKDSRTSGEAGPVQRHDAAARGNPCLQGYQYNEDKKKFVAAPKQAPAATTAPVAPAPAAPVPQAAPAPRK